MTVFHLYRLKLEQSDLLPLFADQRRPPGDVISSAIERKPSSQIRKGQHWRIGNVERLDQQRLFFAFGKLTKKTQELYDDSRGEFVERPFDEAPHTYVALELDLQLCAIARKLRMAQRTETIAKNLETVLNTSRDDGTRHLTFKLQAISDPTEFLDLVRAAARISRFEIAFTPPNPFDVEQQFHRPMEEFLQATRARQGKASVVGDELDRSIIEDLTRSAASTGNTANANIQANDEAKPSPKYSNGNPATVVVEKFSTQQERNSLLDRVRTVYNRIRGTDGQT